MRASLGTVLPLLLLACNGGTARPDDNTTATTDPTTTATTTGPSSTGADPSATGGSTDATTGTTSPDAATDAATDTSSGTTSTDASSTGEPPPLVEEVLLDLPGDVFTPIEGDDLATWHFGQAGTTYQRLRVVFDVTVGPWQPELPDEGNPDRTEHILFGLFRDKQKMSDQRYLGGTAAVTFANKAPHFRMFGRIELAQGYMSYTQWSGTYAWQPGEVYRVECTFDGLLHEQRCTLSLAGDVVAERVGEIAYLDPAAHLDTGFFIELGTHLPGDIECSPLGWVYRDLQVIGARY